LEILRDELKKVLQTDIDNVSIPEIMNVTGLQNVISDETLRRILIGENVKK
jgi:hypothetical protein